MKSAWETASMFQVVDIRSQEHKVTAHKIEIQQ